MGWEEGAAGEKAHLCMSCQQRRLTDHRLSRPLHNCVCRDEVSALHATLQETASCAALEVRGWLLELPGLIQEAIATSLQSEEWIPEVIDTRVLQSAGLEAVQEATDRGVPRCKGEDEAAWAQRQRPRALSRQPCQLLGEGDGRARQDAERIGSGEACSCSLRAGGGGSTHHLQYSGVGCRCSLSAGAAGSGSARHLQCSGSRASTSGLRVALVRLDHMHNRCGESVGLL